MADTQRRDNSGVAGLQSSIEGQVQSIYKLLKQKPGKLSD
jgi:hypothetical protein